MTAVARLVLIVSVIGAVLALLPGSAAAQETTIPVGDLWFCDPSFENGVCTTEIDAGETVVWDFSGTVNAHTTTDCGADCDNPTDSPLWDSGVISAGGGTFAFTFDEPGTYLYYCEVHPIEMRGEIVVQAAAQPPTATAPADGETPTEPADGGPTDGAPSDGEPADGEQADGAGQTNGDAADAVVDVPQAGVSLGEDSSGNRPVLIALAAFGAVLVAIGAAMYRRLLP